MSVSLPPFDSAANPYPPGSRVRVRPVSEWAPEATVIRPLAVGFAEGNRWRQLGWTAEHDDLAGREFEIAVPDRPHTDPCWGLPRIAVPGADGITRTYALHPAMIETAADAPARGCVCDLYTVLMVAGCRCGQMARERGAL